MLCVIGLFAAKKMLGVYFSLLYYIVYPAVIYLIAVGFNVIAQQGTCHGITNLTNCFMGATYTLGYLYATMVAVNLIGPNGILTFEPEEVPILNTSQSAPPPLSKNVEEMGQIGIQSAPPPLPQGSDEISHKNSQDENMTKKKVNDRPSPSGAATNKQQAVSSNVPSPLANPPSAPPAVYSSQSNEGDPQGGGKRILRQRGGVYKDKMSDAALMIRSFFTTLRAPAMSLFIRDPNAATLEDVETKSPVYTGIGIGFWACLATISGQIISNSIAQVC